MRKSSVVGWALLASVVACLSETATPPPFGTIPKPAKPAPAGLLPAPMEKARPEILALDGLWAADGFWDGSAPYVNGAFLLKDGHDPTGSTAFAVESDGTVSVLTNVDFFAFTFVLTRNADGSFAGKCPKDGKRSLFLRKIDPPRNAEPLRAGQISGKWTSVSGYGEKPGVWEFKSGHRISRPYRTKNDPLKVSDNVVTIEEDGVAKCTLYPVYLPSALLTDRPKLVELRGLNGKRWLRLVKQ